LGFVQQKEMEKIQEALLRAPELLLSSESSSSTDTIKNLSTSTKDVDAEVKAETSSDSVSFPIIGTIFSWFSEKRGTPRQPGVCKESQAKLILNKKMFTNPEHTLDGLENFSHIWYAYYS
jgi:hypothetical protein